jgi:apolipoprotein D and lipocalin family protein
VTAAAGVNSGGVRPLRTLLAAWVLGLLAVACAAPREHPPLETVPYVDLSRYQGRWYEIARLPMWFQRGCLQSTADYRLTEAGTVEVTNRCPTEDGGTWVATGRATVVDPRTNARLEVVFDNWFSRLFPSVARGAYWVIELDPAYTLAVVGHPSRDYLWVLSRSPTLDAGRYDGVVGRARALGFPTERLIRPPPTAGP